MVIRLRMTMRNEVEGALHCVSSVRPAETLEIHGEVRAYDGRAEIILSRTKKARRPTSSDSTAAQDL
jgi:hypothetical protein